MFQNIDENKFSTIVTYSTKNIFQSNEKLKSKKDPEKKVHFQENLNEEENDEINTQSNLVKNLGEKYETPKLKNCLNIYNSEFHLERAQTKHRVMKFFNNLQEELTKKNKLEKFEKEKEEDSKNSEHIELDERFNQTSGRSKMINEFQISHNYNEKTQGMLSPVGEKEVLKNDDIENEELELEKHIISEENENNKINYINNFNDNVNNLEKFDPKMKYLYSNTKYNNDNQNKKEILDADKIKLNFNLKDTFKTEDQNTIYNNSDVDSEYTILDNKILRDENIIFSNSNNNNSVLIKESLNKTFNGLKQLLLCSRTVINNAHDIIQTFSSCYQWINENYLKEHIKKKMAEEEKERRRREEKDYNTKNNVARKKKQVKKKIIKTPDESFKILLNIIMGIQIAVQSCPNFRIKKEEEITNYLNNMIYSIQTINFGKKQEELFFLKEFAGIIFNNIRLMFGIDKDTFISSISPQEFVTEIMISSQTIFEELCSTGKSGSLLYYTRDGKFIVKTISKKEYKFFKKILVNYYNHLKNYPLSFLPKFLGCYKLIREIKNKKKKYNIYFIVMMNVFATSNHIDKRYDLKGSKINRKVLKGTLEDQKILDQGDMALKDLDFENKKEKIYIGKKKDIIIAQLEKDAKFLEDMGANDYSLLLGIHNLQNKTRTSVPFPIAFQKCHTIDYNAQVNNNIFNTDKKNKITRTISLDKESNLKEKEEKILFKELYDFDDKGILSSYKDKIYYLGIIDILTQYDFAKKTEHLCKMLRYCSEEMSCIPPNKYKVRFINYMTNTVFDDKELLRKIPINDIADKDIPKNLYFSQNLNSELNKINKNVELNEDNKSDNSNNNDNFYKKSNKNNNYINNLNLNSEESDYRLNFNFNKNTKINNVENNKDNNNNDNSK